MGVSADGPGAFIDIMLAFFTDHEYMPCEGCGASLARGERVAHECDEQRRLDYELFRLLRDELRGFDEWLGAYLNSPAGRFAVYYAARERRSGAG